MRDPEIEEPIRGREWALSGAVISDFMRYCFDSEIRIRYDNIILKIQIIRNTVG